MGRGVANKPRLREVSLYVHLNVLFSSCKTITNRVSSLSCISCILPNGRVPNVSRDFPSFITNAWTCDCRKCSAARKRFAPLKVFTLIRVTSPGSRRTTKPGTARTARRSVCALPRVSNELWLHGFSPWIAVCTTGSEVAVAALRKLFVTFPPLGSPIGHLFTYHNFSRRKKSK